MLRVIVSSAVLWSLCGCPETVEKPKPAAPPAEKVARPVLVPTTRRPTVNPMTDEGPPSFVTRGSGIFEDQGKRWFYGVGKANGVENMMKAHLLADQSANAELIAQVDPFHRRAIEALGAEVKPKLDAFAKSEVEMAEIVDHWIDHDHDAWYSLRRIETAGYADRLAKALGLDEDARTKLGAP